MHMTNVDVTGLSPADLAVTHFKLRRASGQSRPGSILTASNHSGAPMAINTGSNLTSHAQSSAPQEFKRRNSYRLRRWSGFDAWQEHVRQSAPDIGGAFTRIDRDLRRVTVAG